MMRLALAVLVALAPGLARADTTLLAALDAAGFWWAEDYAQQEALKVQIEEDGVTALWRSERFVLLDAEALAEQGLFDALLDMGPNIRLRGGAVTSLETLRADGKTYQVTVNGVTYDAYTPDGYEDSWPLATQTFWQIVTDLTPNSEDRFYMLGLGNDLMGAFLPDSVIPFFEATGRGPYNVPYIPTRIAPNYGAPTP